MHVDVATALSVADLHPETEQIAELPLKGLEIGVYRASCGTFRRSSDIVAWARPDLFRKMFGLADR